MRLPFRRRERARSTRKGRRWRQRRPLRHLSRQICTAHGSTQGRRHALTATQITTDHQQLRRAPGRRTRPRHADPGRAPRSASATCSPSNSRTRTRCATRCRRWSSSSASPTRPRSATRSSSTDAWRPTSHELCATMFIELDQDADVRAELARLDGIQNAVEPRDRPVGAGDGRRPSRVRRRRAARAGRGPRRPSDTVSVHVVRFTLTDEQRDAFRDPQVPVELVVEHPEYAESTPITGATRLSLLADLALDQPRRLTLGAASPRLPPPLPAISPVGLPECACGSSSSTGPRQGATSWFGYPPVDGVGRHDHLAVV